MLNFNFYSPTRIIFGKDSEQKIGSLICPKRKKILLHYGGQSIKKSGLYDRVISSLKTAGIEIVELGGVKPNPRLALVYQGIELCRKEKVDSILAVGGGSVIDSAKAIAIGTFYEGDVWDLFTKGAKAKEALPLATILTIPAAGSESSPNMVISKEETEQKYGYGNQILRPYVSIINPELFYSLPSSQISNGASDMMSHIFERYFTNTTHTDLTDGLCESTLKSIMKNALLVKANPRNYEAWCEIGFAGNIAHNGLLGMGREEDWGCHKIEHELSAIYDIPHGAGLAVITPAWMQYVYKSNPKMFVQFAVNVMGVEGSFRDEEALIKEGIKRLCAFYKAMDLPISLKELKIDDSKLELMAQKATGFAFKAEEAVGFFKKLLWQDVLEIYKLAR